jgi:hypothetical protein
MFVHPQTAQAEYRLRHHQLVAGPFALPVGRLEPAPAVPQVAVDVQRPRRVREKRLSIIDHRVFTGATESDRHVSLQAHRTDRPVRTEQDEVTDRKLADAGPRGHDCLHRVSHHHVNDVGDGRFGVDQVQSASAVGRMELPRAHSRLAFRA